MFSKEKSKIMTETYLYLVGECKSYIFLYSFLYIITNISAADILDKHLNTQNFIKGTFRMQKIMKLLIIINYWLQLTLSKIKPISPVLFVHVTGT